LEVLECEDTPESLVCRFSGRIDTNAANEMENSLLEKVGMADKPVVFDFSGLEYVASSFLRLCVKVVRVLGSSRLRVVGASGEIVRILEMTGFSKLMDIEPVDGEKK